MSQDESNAKFLRQGSWMVVTSMLMLIFMSAVHIFGPIMGEKEYGLFSTLLGMLNVIAIPCLGLQTVFTHQAASVTTAEDRARLAGTAHTLLKVVLLVSAAFACGIAFFQHQILTVLAIPSPVALWLVVVMGVIAAVGPVFGGTLTGNQNFFWFGWAQAINGIGRFVAIGVLVGFCGAKAIGAMAGALIGAGFALIILIYQSRSAWLTKDRLSPRWGDWLREAVPLTFALGTYQCLFGIDVMIVRAMFGEDQTGYYNAAGMFARGMVALIAPLAAVMFPKIVSSHAAKRHSNALFITIICSAILAVLGAASCHGFGLGLQYLADHKEWGAKVLPGAFAVKLQNSPEGFRIIGQLLPWFGWAMVPLLLSNVLLNNLLARRDYRCVSSCIVIAVAYIAAVVTFGSPDVANVRNPGDVCSFVRVIQILGLFNLVFLGVLGWFNKTIPKPVILEHVAATPKDQAL